MERLEEAEDQRLDWGLTENSGLHSPPDLTEVILARMETTRNTNVVGGVPQQRGGDIRDRRMTVGGWASLVAVAAALFVVAWIAWLSRGDTGAMKNPELPSGNDRGRWAVPQDRREPDHFARRPHGRTGPLSLPGVRCRLRGESRALVRPGRGRRRF